MNKYIRPGNGAGTSRNYSRERVLGALLVLVTVALVIMTILGVSAMAYRNESQELFVARLQGECGEAIGLTNKLSRLAGAGDSVTLGYIRGHVSAMETINNLQFSLHGAHAAYVQEAVFEELHDTLDAYGEKLLTGMSTGEQQTQLLTMLQNLMAQLETL